MKKLILIAVCLALSGCVSWGTKDVTNLPQGMTPAAYRELVNDYLIYHKNNPDDHLYYCLYAMTHNLPVPKECGE